MRINAHTARTSQAAPHHAISPLYSPPRGSIAAIVLRLEILFGIEGRRRREFSEQDEMVLRVAFTTKERPLWYTTKPPMLFLWYFLPQTICVISGTHVVIHNWSFVVKLCGTNALLYKSFVVQLLFPQAQKWVCGNTSGGRRDGL